MTDRKRCRGRGNRSTYHYLGGRGDSGLYRGVTGVHEVRGSNDNNLRTGKPHEVR